MNVLERRGETPARSAQVENYLLLTLGPQKTQSWPSNSTNEKTNVNLRMRSPHKKAKIKKMWWVCSENPNHEWMQFVAIRHNQGSCCPHCKNKWETEATNTIEEILLRKATTKPQYPLENFFFDIRIDFGREKYLIELDGEQHYEDKPHWGHLLKGQQYRDKKKTKISSQIEKY